MKDFPSLRFVILGPGLILFLILLSLLFNHNPVLAGCSCGAIIGDSCGSCPSGTNCQSFVNEGRFCSTVCKCQGGGICSDEMCECDTGAEAKAACGGGISSPCLAGICSGAGGCQWNGNAGDCKNAGCTWTPTCCDPNNSASSTYVSGGYCSAACNGQCQYDAGSGNWQWASCSPGPCGGTVQGYKVLMPNNQNVAPAANQTVRLDGGSPTTANPYFFTNVSAANHTVTVSVPAGYAVVSTLCYNRTDCHTDSCATGGSCPVTNAYQAGSSRTVNVPSGGYADLWWHYNSPPTCTVDLVPALSSFSIGSTLNMTANVVPSNGTVDKVDFSSSNTTKVTVSPTSDATSPYQTVATGVSVGSSTITANVYMNASLTCSGTSSLTVTNPGPWWQVKDADVATGGSLTSSIPDSCSLPSCNPVFNLNGDGGYPGVPSYVGSYKFTSGVGLGTVSSRGWIANSQTLFKKIYDYTFFKSQIPSDVSSMWAEINEDWGCTLGAPSCTINGGGFNSRGNPSTTHGNYVWFHFDGSKYGDLVINGNVNISRKAVLMVEGADLNLSGKINLTKGVSFFMAVVGKDTNGQKGNITVDPNLTSPNSSALDGIYYADGTFSTGAGNKWLWIHGSVATQGGINLQRNLADNSTQPAEYFEYAPELMTLYPNVFTNRRMRWKEVAP